MELEKKIITYLDAVDLSDDLCEIVRSTPPPNFCSSYEELKKSVNNIISSVNEIFQNKENIYKMSQELMELPDFSKEENISIFSKLVDEYNDLVKSSGMEEIFKLLMNPSELSGDTCERLYKFVDDINLDDNSRAVFMFNISVCCGATSPKMSYMNMMQAFRLKPNLVQIKGRDTSGLCHFPIPEQYTFEHCPICGGKGEPYFNAVSFRINTYNSIFEPAKLWMKCEDCNNMYTYHFPKSILDSGKVMKKIEPHVSNNCIGNVTGYLHIWNNVINSIKKFTNGKDILEVGVGRGEFIAVAQELGYEIESVEILEDAAQNVANILGADIWCCDFMKFETDKRYSIITMGDVIEHVIDPEAALRKAYMFLRDDGVLWLSTPNFESSFSRIYKFYDVMWCEPYHISYFNYTNFCALAEKCGFKVEEYEVSARYNGSMELILRKK